MVRSTMLAVAAAVLCACLCACTPASEEASVQSAALAGTSWTITAVEGQAPVAGRGGAPTIAFDADNRVSGSTGCNSFSGGYAIGAGGALTLGGEGGGLATTRMACEPPLNAQETWVLAALGAVVGYAIAEDGSLSLANAAGETVLLAAPASAGLAR